MARSAENISVRNVINASELTTFDLHCISHPVDETRCADSTHCSIRPVWMMLQEKIDGVLESVRLIDLLEDEPRVRDVVRERAGERTRLPVLQG